MANITNYTDALASGKTVVLYLESGIKFCKIRKTGQNRYSVKDTAFGAWDSENIRLREAIGFILRFKDIEGLKVEVQ